MARMTDEKGPTMNGDGQIGNLCQPGSACGFSITISITRWVPQVRARLNGCVLVIIVGLIWFVVSSFVELVQWIIASVK
jgi:hypothetical protein